MHISEGLLSPQVFLGGAAIATGGVAMGLKRLHPENIPGVGILSAAFFVASLIHVPVGPVSAHLVFNGLLGLMLGWTAFPAVLVGLALQALLFQYGGITTLGVNTLNMAVPALICHYLFRRGVTVRRPTVIFMTASFATGFFAVLLSGIMVGFSLYLSGDFFLPAARLVVAAHFPVMIIEGALTTVCALYIKKTKPELLEIYDEPKTSE